jgi:hypothetical protein
VAVDDAMQDNQALFEAAVFLNHFNDLSDPRQRVKVMHPLEEALLLAPLAVLALHVEQRGRMLLRTLIR